MNLNISYNVAKEWIKMIALLSIIILLSGCSASNDWTGFYYRDKDNINDENTWTIQPGLKSKEDCQNWIKMVSANNSNYDYECGYKCRYDDTYKTSICETTVK